MGARGPTEGRVVEAPRTCGCGLPGEGECMGGQGGWVRVGPLGLQGQRTRARGQGAVQGRCPKEESPRWG